MNDRGRPTGTMTTWRTGRKQDRTLYVQAGPEPSDDDELIGVIFVPGLAAEAVQAVNGTHAALSAARERIVNLEHEKAMAAAEMESLRRIYDRADVQRTALVRTLRSALERCGTCSSDGDCLPCQRAEAVLSGVTPHSLLP